MKIVALALLSLLVSSFVRALVFSEAVEDSWEPEERRTVASLPLRSFSLLTEVSVLLISFYQTEISPQSISRCPFKISCSTFAKRAIEEYGLFGLAMFIDRYYYRENHEVFAHYRLVVSKEGILKLDDAPFLFKKDE